jgi:hypothetical protein
MIYSRLVVATIFKMTTQRADQFISTYDGRLTDTHMYKRTEERVAIICPEHGISRFLFGVEFIFNSDNVLIRKTPTALK